MTSVRDHYVIGRLGSYLVPTVARCDAEIGKLTARIPGQTGRERRTILDEIDRLLDRRSVLVEAAKERV